MVKFYLLFIVVFLLAFPSTANAESTQGIDAATLEATIDETVGSATDSGAIQREEQKNARDGFNVAEQKLIEQTADKHEFQAEVNKLMSIIVNSLYYNNEVFLRELISNASDALDKIRFLGLTDKTILGETPDMEIRIKVDKENGVLHLMDTGLGMTREDLVNNLGTIAQSGTKEFIERLQEGGDSNLIGQFGVGFYSAFLVADVVTVTTKHNDDVQLIWQSTSENSFTISEDPRGDTLGRGTVISLKMKEDATHFMEENTIKKLVSKYSSFISFPIYLWSSHEEDREVEIPEEEKTDEDTAEDTPDEENVEVEGEDGEDEEAEPEKPKTKTITETIWAWEVINDTKPLWTRDKAKITEGEYIEFFKSMTKETADPLNWIHFSAEGEIEFKALLYIPGEAPTGMFDNSQEQDFEFGKALKLYVRRVFITDEFDDIIPKYLSFIRGLIDSDDLPLNVSREVLQHHKTLKIIKKKVVRKAIGMLADMAEDKEKYEKFWKSFGTNVKLGLIEDQTNRTRLSKLLMFYSSKTKELTLLQDYVERMRQHQEQIYYLACESIEQCENSPLLERMNAKGYEVLFMTEAIDEYCLGNLPKFDGIYLVTNIARENVELDGVKDDKEEKKQIKEDFEPLTKYLKSQLSDTLEKAVVSNRLTTSPTALVSAQFGYTANMERILKMQALSDPRAKLGLENKPKKILEINPKHPIVLELKQRIEADEQDETAAITAKVLYETAVLSSGFAVDEPADFASWIHKMMAVNLDIPTNFEENMDLPEEEALPDKTEEEPEDEEAEEAPAQDIPEEVVLDAQEPEPKEEL